MLRERIDEYLDGNLDAPGMRELEAVLAQDPAADKLRSQLKAERALRAAAYESYLPTRQEAHALATRVLDEAYHTPLGRVGYWIRHGSAVAAAVLVVAGSFLAGWASKPATVRTVTISQTPEERVEFVPAYMDQHGNQVVGPSCQTAEEAKSFLTNQGSPKAPTADDVQAHLRRWNPRPHNPGDN
jgi:anti-sigma factor RsiW